ncbi:DUF1992 domain-containing protein [Chloroflexia bacterium SDU3-3]|nr:DUF1992 domain-containing protein [Chloroflexia bacterium SDU3-3]
MQQQDPDRDEERDERPQPITPRRPGSFIDQQIAQAEAAGQFANLPGQGQPLPSADDRFVPEEDRLGYRMLGTTEFSPPWIEARKDIDEERRRIDGWLVHANDRWPHLDGAGRTKLQGEFRQKLEGLRSMILDYNLRVPPSVGQMRGLELARELRRLGVE